MMSPQTVFPALILLATTHLSCTSLPIGMGIQDDFGGRTEFITITGTVNDVETDLPIEEVSVSILTGGVVTTKTDANGQFKLVFTGRRLHVVSFRLMVGKDGYKMSHESYNQYEIGTVYLTPSE